MGKPSVLWAFDRETGAHLGTGSSFQNIYKNIDENSGAITPNEEIVPRPRADRGWYCPECAAARSFRQSVQSQSDAIFTVVSLACSIFEILPLDKSTSGFNWTACRPCPDPTATSGDWPPFARQPASCSGHATSARRWGPC
jgi:hypothetical protein